jgi:hypothetical protein
MAATATAAAELRCPLAGFFLAVVATACGGDELVPTPTGSTCPPGSTLSYESFGRPFFDRYCQSCHATTVTGPDRRGAPATRFYDTVDRIRNDADIDPQAAAGPDAFNEVMPPSRPRPTDEERFLLGEWLACGAP